MAAAASALDPDHPRDRLRRPGRARRRRAPGRRGRARGHRRRGPAAGRLPGAPRPVRRGRHGPGAARSRRAWSTAARDRGVGGRHGQDAVQAHLRGRSTCRCCRGSRSAPSDWADATGVLLAELEAFAADLPDPRLVIKPARLGSSIGISIVHRPDEPPELETALAEALRFDDLVLAEPYLDHPRELEVSVVGDLAADLEVYGPGEVLPGREFYDYVAKYRSGASTQRPGARPGRRPRGRGSGASPASVVPGHRRQRLRARRLPARRGRPAVRVGDQHHPGLHAHQPLPAAVRAGRLRLRRHLRAHRGPRPRACGARAARVA